MNRHLLVISTRGYADKGSPDDEFYTQWGFEKNDDFKWFTEYKGVVLLIIHGYRGYDPVKAEYRYFDPDKAVNDAKDKNKKLDISGVSFFHHSIGGQPKKGETEKQVAQRRIDSTAEAIQKKWGHYPSPIQEYHSRSGLAAEELKKDIWVHEGLKDLREYLIEAIDMAAGGRPLFVQKLIGVQSALIRFRLLLEVVVKNKGDGLKDQIQQVGNDISLLTGGERGCFRRWLHFIEGKERKGEESAVAGPSTGPHEKLAVKLMLYFAGATEAKAHVDNILKLPDVWGAIKRAPKSVRDRAKDQWDDVLQDICLFSRTIDVLLNVAERLPRSLLSESEAWEDR